jgi:hypothetical protein
MVQFAIVHRRGGGDERQASVSFVRFFYVFFVLFLILNQFCKEIFMKKFWTMLALLAVALNFSSVSLWAQEVKDQAAVAAKTVNGDVAKDVTNEETALENAAVKDDENSKVEEVAPVATKPALPAVSEEEKKEDMGAPVLPDTTQGQDKIS